MQRLPGDTRPEGTIISEERLLAVATSHIMKGDEELPKDSDYYLTLVAEAANLPYEEVKKLHWDGDAGIMMARARIKGLMFARVMGSGWSPGKASEEFKAWSRRSTRMPTTGTPTSSSTPKGPSKT